jgi:hypothetical protein
MGIAYGKALAMARLSGLRLNGGRNDGFGWLLLGLVSIGLLAWIFNPSAENASDKE